MVPANWETQREPRSPIVSFASEKSQTSVSMGVIHGNEANTPTPAKELEMIQGRFPQNLPHDSSSWSENPYASASLQAAGKSVEPLQAKLAADYLRIVWLPKMRPDAQLIAIEAPPKLTSYLNDELSGPKIAWKSDSGDESTVTDSDEFDPTEEKALKAGKRLKLHDVR